MIKQHLFQFSDIRDVCLQFKFDLQVIHIWVKLMLYFVKVFFELFDP